MSEVERPGAVDPGALADSSPSPLFLVQDRLFRYANPAFAELLGSVPARLLGQPIVDVIHPHDRAHVLERLDEHQRGRKETHRIQFRVRRPSGEDVWVYATLAPFVQDERAASIGTAFEVRERRHAQDAVSKAQRLDAVARLAGGIAHGFNNALQAILGHAERIVATVPDDLPARRAALDIRHHAARAADLTDQLLSLGQRQVLAPQPTDIARLLQELRGPIERRVGAQVLVTVRSGPTTALARVDGTRFVHMLAALIDHARDAMPTGGQLSVVTDRVTIDEKARTERPWLRDGDFVRLSVEDSGPGLDVESAAHMFEPFYSTTSGDGGLGMATVYGLVKQSQGFVWAEAGHPRGTRVVVLLPVDVGTAAVLDQAVAPAAVVRTDDRIRVLLVEDESAVRELLTHALERHGFTVMAAGSAEEAVDVPMSSYDVLVSDISLPGMNGVELARRVRATGSAVKVLLMSGYAREVFLTPADDLPFIGKPFTTRAIVERLRALAADVEAAPPAPRLR